MSSQTSNNNEINVLILYYEKINKMIKATYKCASDLIGKSSPIKRERERYRQTDKGRLTEEDRQTEKNRQTDRDRKTDRERESVWG